MLKFIPRQIRSFIVVGLWIVAPSSIEGQSPAQAQVLEAIRSGQIKITDEMIANQKRNHPELRKLSNQEIKDRLMGKPSAGPSADTTRGQGREQEHPTSDTISTSQPWDTTSTSLGKPPNLKKRGEVSSRFPEGILRFGYDFFSTNTNQGIFGASSPALPEYVLSPGDEIQISTWGRENQNQTVVIDNEGMVHYTPLQPMRIAGMKFADAQRALVTEIEKINGVKASVGMGKLKSIRIFVLGEAVNPGSYVVSAGATVTSALFMSGGIKEIGSLRGVQLKRDGRVVAQLDLYEMLLKGNNKSDQQLIAGDVIFVPVAPIQIAITGMVKRTGIYEVKPGTKVLNALELAGGLSSNAFKGRVRLDRIEMHRRKVVLDIGMERVGGNANVSLVDGDILNVEEVLAKEYDVVYLEGNVNRPGRYEFKKGMSIRDLIPGVKDLKSETFFAYGHIKRTTDDEQRALLLPFSLKDVFENGAMVELMPRDTVIVYNKYDIMDQPEAKVAGSVRRPGSVPFLERMRVSDLVIAGGGLTIDAYLPEAHLIRVLKIEESDSLFTTLVKVNLANLIANPGDENNVEIRPSDSLIIFPRSNFVLPKFVSLTGAVKNPGTFELSINMGVPELISQANGLTKTTYLLNIEVVRRSIERDSVVTRQIHRMNLHDIISGKVRFALQDGDAVYVRDVVDHHGKIVVTMSGEFNFPGKYEAAKGERISNLIRRAGGFTESAYLRGAVFIRKSVMERQIQALEDINRKLEDQLQNLLSQTTNEKDRASVEYAIRSRKSIVENIRSAPYLGRVVVSLDAKYKFEGGESDILIEDGDSLFVRSKPSTISIMGEVFSPTNLIVSSKSKSVGNCLNQAGGLNEYGDHGNIYYVKPDGSIITPKNTSFFKRRSVEPGGAIIVPPKGPKKDYLDAMTKITQIIYQMAISVGVAAALF